MRRLLLVLAMVVPAPRSSAAAEAWTLARSPHFEVAPSRP
jgi:hypothetical protein